ncbi:MAG TPA: OsmC family protein [Bryobacteraceae bacterium]|nr:OsmC family protein [Bryobacteraceae bacterium]
MGLETKITYLDGVRFQVAARGHEITSDQPLENGGTDRGMTPPELLLASLGSCAAYYAAEYLRARSLPTTGLVVTVIAQKAQKPARLMDFRIGLSIPGLDDPRHREGILRAAKNCLIHNTLLHAPRIDIELENKNAEVEQRQPELVEKA